ncbi:hypothetical protein MSWH1_2044 [Methanosarcina sp. WH1]|nr:hypothetical protein MSWH1_2044 [Methanosarcina sp. WH1]
MEDSKRAELIEFAVKYNGKAVESNEMDANAVATSLLGLSTAIETANSILNGSNAKVSVKVHGSFRPGSFIIDIASFYSTPSVIQTVFNSGNIETVHNVIETLGIVSAGVCSAGAVTYKTLIWLYKKIKGKKILTKKSLDENTCQITVEGCNEEIPVNIIVLNLYENKKIQQALENVVSPLDDEDMSDITFLVDGKEQEKILREERGYFHLEDTDIIDKKEDVDHFVITQCNFEGKQTGWRLSFGNSQQSKGKLDDFSVKVLDENFLHMVSRKEVIISNEGTVIIEARYRKTTHKAERLTVNWEILEVLNTDSLTNNHKHPKYKAKSFDEF